MTQRDEVSKCSWKNRANRLTQCRVATNLQFVKNTSSAKHNKSKCNKMRYAYICHQAFKAGKCKEVKLKIKIRNFILDKKLGADSKIG